MKSKNIQSLKTPQFSPFNKKIQNTPYQSLKLKSIASKNSQTKKYSLTKDNYNFITLQNYKQSVNKPQNLELNFCNQSISLQQQKYNQLNHRNHKKQTFRDFIRQIQSYNQNHIIKHNQDTFFQQLTSKDQSNFPDQQKINITLEVNLKSSIKSQNLEKQTILQEKQKPINSLTSEKPKNFIIHDKMNRKFLTRGYQRSKTEQEISIKKINFPENNNSQESHFKKNCSLQNVIFSKTISKLKQLDTTQNQLKYINIKLVQKRKSNTPSSTTKQFIQSNFSLQPFASHLTNSQICQRDLQNQKKNLDSKHSKIRIRLGSSLYSKNLCTLQSSNSTSKNKLKKEPQNFMTESVTIHNKRNFKRNQNSQFFQNKITEAQNICIQKRRLLPTAQIKSRENLVRTKKQFFTISNSFDKYRNQKVEIEIESSKGQNLNGWQSNDQGLTHYKIDQFF